jgi:hypothetical protein
MPVEVEAPEGIRVSLSGSGQVNDKGRFEIIAITAGEGNGWVFGSDVLKDSLSLWDGVECFVDHGSWFGTRKVKDLGGVCRKRERNSARVKSSWSMR